MKNKCRLETSKERIIKHKGTTGRNLETKWDEYHRNNGIKIAENQRKIQTESEGEPGNLGFGKQRDAVAVCPLRMS